MDIDRRAFLASVGGLAVVEALDPEAKAEALEHYMMEKLDEDGRRPDPRRRGAGGRGGA